MKTLEDILQGVTAPEQMRVDTRHPPLFFGDCYELETPSATVGNIDRGEDAVFLARAARNFAPLVRALEGLLYANNVPGGPAQALSDARKALREALADEP